MNEIKIILVNKMCQILQTRIKNLTQNLIIEIKEYLANRNMVEVRRSLSLKPISPPRDDVSGARGWWRPASRIRQPVKRC